MAETTLDVGRVVRSKAGRDKSGIYIVVEALDNDYVLIANGSDRSIDKPKRKKIKHLEPLPSYVAWLSDRKKEGSLILDAEIRKSLKSLGYE